MDIRYNILYFPNNVDIRLCPKNATVSLKAAFNLAYRSYNEMYNEDGTLKDAPLGEADRKIYVDKVSYWVDFPFRRKSIRIAIKRDPVKRFLSACNYYIRQQTKYANKLYDPEWYARNHVRGEPVYPEIATKTVRGIINQLEKRDIKDCHFYSQSHFLGHPDDYDLIFEINEMDKVFEYINKNCDLKNEIPFLRKNNSDTYKSFGSTLTPRDIESIKEFYSKDYKRGWYTETSI